VSSIDQGLIEEAKFIELSDNGKFYRIQRSLCSNELKRQQGDSGRSV